MEELFRPEVAPPLPDLVAAVEGFGNELTRSNSNSSALIVEGSKYVLHHKEIVRTDECTTWTNDNHRLYLASLEASFVNQLHRSMGLLARRSEPNIDPSSYMQLPANIRNSSDQFMVQRDGCWQKMSFNRSCCLMETEADSHVNLNSPWIRRFKSSSKHRTIASNDLQEHSTLSSVRAPQRGNRAFRCRHLEELPLYHSYRQHSVGSITEVSDQNFVDGEQEEISSTSSMAKRLKIAATDASSKDQTVPSGEFHRTGNSTIPNTPPEK